MTTIIPTSLGNPNTDEPSGQGFSRNIWDLQTVGGKLLIGYGDSALVNAGPIFLRWYDPADQAFHDKASSIPNNTIVRIRLFGGVAYFQNLDPTYGWSNDGDFTTWDGTTYTQHQTCKVTTSSGSTHQEDCYLFGGVLYASWTETVIGKSSDLGANQNNWTNLAGGGEEIATGTFFEVNGALYMTSGLLGTCCRINSNGSLTVFNNDQFGPAHNYQGMPHRNLPIDATHTILIWLNPATSDYDPSGAYVSTGPGSTTAISISGSPKIYDVIQDGASTYLLGALANGGNWDNIVYASTDLSTWTERFRFTHAGFARSFELLNGCFFFGIGQPQSVPGSGPAGEILVYRPRLPIFGSTARTTPIYTRKRFV